MEGVPKASLALPTKTLYDVSLQIVHMVGKLCEISSQTSEEPETSVDRPSNNGFLTPLLQLHITLLRCNSHFCAAASSLSNNSTERSFDAEIVSNIVTLADIMGLKFGSHTSAFVQLHKIIAVCIAVLYARAFNFYQHDTDKEDLASTSFLPLAPTQLSSFIEVTLTAHILRFDQNRALEIHQPRLSESRSSVNWGSPLPYPNSYVSPMRNFVAQSFGFNRLSRKRSRSASLASCCSTAADPGVHVIEQNSFSPLHPLVLADVIYHMRCVVAYLLDIQLIGSDLSAVRALDVHIIFLMNYYEDLRNKRFAEKRRALEEGCQVFSNQGETQDSVNHIPIVEFLTPERPSVAECEQNTKKYDTLLSSLAEFSKPSPNILHGSATSEGLTPAHCVKEIHGTTTSLPNTPLVSRNISQPGTRIPRKVEDVGKVSTQDTCYESGRHEPEEPITMLPSVFQVLFTTSDLNSTPTSWNKRAEDWIVCMPWVVYFWSWTRDRLLMLHDHINSIALESSCIENGRTRFLSIRTALSETTEVYKRVTMALSSAYRSLKLGDENKDLNPASTYQDVLKPGEINGVPLEITDEYGLDVFSLPSGLRLFFEI